MAAIGFVIGCAVGFVIGCKVTSLVIRGLVVGKLRIDKSDPEDGPFMFLELSKSIDEVEKKGCIVLKVESENFISHK